MSKFRNLIFAFTFAAAIPWLQAGQTSGFTLEELVKEALAKNPELKFYEAEIAAARGQHRQTGTLQNPELSAELGSKSVHDLAGNKLGDGPVWAVSIAQTFEFPGRVSLRKAIAGKQIELAQLGLEQFRTALANQVRQLGYRAMAAEQKAEAAKEVAARFQDLLAVLVQRDPAGVAPMLDTRIIEASALTLARRSSQAAQERQAALYELNQLRGANIITPVHVARTDVRLSPLPELARLFTSARSRNFDVRTRVAELEQQGFHVQLSENERWPSVTVKPYIAGEHASDRQREFGLGISLPLPLWDQKKGSIETAKARQLQAEVSVNVTLREIERRIAETAHAYRTQIEEMGKWRADSLDRFREAAALGDRHYRLGALPIATYTELQKQYLDALDALLGTQGEALASRSELERLTGLDLTRTVPAKVALYSK
jgi:cobalt-zinc-cadmium efflux system outer membrane protein